MNCKTNRNDQEELLLEYCSAKLPPEQAQECELHLESCAECRETVALQRAIDESLMDWEPSEVSEDFNRKLFARINAEQEQAQPWWKTLFAFQFSWKPMIPVAVASLALVAFLNWPQDNATSSAQLEPIPVEQIEQVERALDDMEALQALHQPDTVEGAKEKL